MPTTSPTTSRRSPTTPATTTPPPPSTTRRTPPAPPARTRPTRSTTPSRTARPTSKLYAPRGHEAHRSGRSGAPFCAGLGLAEGFHDPLEQAAAVGAAVGGLDHPFGVGHHAQHVARLVEDAGDVARRAVAFAGVAEGDPPLPF